VTEKLEKEDPNFESAVNNNMQALMTFYEKESQKPVQDSPIKEDLAVFRQNSSVLQNEIETPCFNKPTMTILRSSG
jgi:hypothetical protein